MTCFGQETFGPVVSLYRFHDEADAVARANDGRVRPERLGLQPGRRPGPGARPPDPCGTVNINEAFAATFASIDAPMGGMRQSGMGRRQGGEGILRYTETQSVATQRLHPLRADARHVRGGLRQGDDREPAADEEARESADDRQPTGSFDYDVLVVGSGFGGSVTALRLTEKGYRVGVLEAGARFDGRGLRRRPRGTSSATCSAPRSAATASSASTRSRTA